MMKCATCGNEYDKVIEVRRGDRSLAFDCFECAIQALAPTCGHCACRIIGHGVEEDGAMFCSAHCAREAGRTAVRDRA